MKAPVQWLIILTGGLTEFMRSDMRFIDIQEVKIHLSRLAEEAHNGNSFIITKVGKPIAQVNPLPESHCRSERKLGTLGGIFNVPDNFDTNDHKQIEKMFSGEK